MDNERLWENVRFRSSRKSGKVLCERDWNWMMPAMPDYDLWYAIDGVGRITINGASYPVEGGTCFLLRPGDAITAEHHPDNRLTVLYAHFTCETANGRRAGPDAGPPEEPRADPPGEPLAAWPRRIPVEDAVWLKHLMERLIALDEEPENDADGAESDALLRAALLMLKRDGAPRKREGRMPAAVRTVIRTIRENASAPLSHEELARIAGLSERYLNVLFKRHTGMSLRTFTAKARIERACRLLEESSLSVGQIAEALGDRDIYFCSRQFKQFAGVPPTAYRRHAAASRRYGAPKN